MTILCRTRPSVKQLAKISRPVRPFGEGIEPKPKPADLGWVHNCPDRAYTPRPHPGPLPKPRPAPQPKATHKPKTSPAPVEKPAAKPTTPRRGFYDRATGAYIPSVDEDRWLSEDNARRQAERRRVASAACESAAVNAMSLGLVPRDLAAGIARMSLVGHNA